LKVETQPNPIKYMIVKIPFNFPYKTDLNNNGICIFIML